MKRIINGLLFDTDNAQLLASGYLSKRAVQALYKTKKSNFVLTTIDGREEPEFQDNMVHLSPSDAITWLETYRNNEDFIRRAPVVSVDEIYKIHFNKYLKEA